MSTIPATMRAQEERSGGRQVEPELLDELPPDDPQAIGSRRDLRRVNAWMGNARILHRILQELPRARAPRSVAEIGGGDGTFLLHLARRLAPEWKETSAWVIDRQQLVTPETRAGFVTLGWKLEAVQSDVFDWLVGIEPVDVMVANLFLHHFAERRLTDLLELVASKTTVFAACEPRRFAFPRLAGGCVALIGCNAVTRHDAVASVRAGFAGQELSALWPRQHSWRLREGKAGWFSHSFLAVHE